MGLTVALGNALSGIRAGNGALEVVSRNISNAGTPGYHKQSINLVDNTSTGSSYVLQGGVQRAFNSALQTYYNNQVSDTSYSTVIASYMDKLQTYMGKPGDDGSLDTVFADFQNALKDLQTSPDDYSARSQAVSNAQQLAATLNRLSGAVQGMRNDTESAISDAVSQLNANLKTLKDVNDRLSDFGTDQDSRNTLLDQRDRLVASIAEQIDVKADYRSDGTVALMTRSGVGILDVKASQFSFDPAGSLTATSDVGDAGKLTITGPSGTKLDLVKQDVLQSGSLGALIKLRDDVLPTAQNQLDDIAASLAQAFSTNQTQGTATTDASGAKGFNLDLSTVRGGNDFTFSYVENGKTKTARIVSVDDASKLPIDYVDTDGTRVVGIDFNNNDAASVAAQLNGKFQGKVNFAGTGATLSVLDDGPTGSVDISQATVRSTSSGEQDGGLGLSLFMDGSKDYTGSLDGQGQKAGLASRITVNADVVANNSLLVQYSGDTAMGDTTRPDYLAKQLDQMRFSSGPGKDYSLSGSVDDFINQTINYQGNRISAAMADQDTQSQSLDVLGQRMDGEFGVNVDEEMSRLMELQNAYAANARVISVVQDLLQAIMQSI